MIRCTFARSGGHQTEQFRSIEHSELRVSPTSRLYVEEKGTGSDFQLQAGGGNRGISNGREVPGGGWPGKYLGVRSAHLHRSGGRGLLQIDSFQRGESTRFFPCYRGRFELTVAGEDTFLVINEVSLEDYLIQVVPSEMPVTWPMEALKAQAVAARTYAVAQAVYSRQGHLGFHVTDSTNSQVYNNAPESARATQAIWETDGQILVNPEGTVTSTYFYSTSPRNPLTDSGVGRI